MFYITKVVVLLSVFCVIAIAAPYQELPYKPGYVPVYIRIGNTPLTQINPQLVEAFHEDEKSSQAFSRNESQEPDDAEIVIYDKKNQRTESMKREDEKNMTAKQLNGNTVINRN